MKLNLIDNVVSYVSPMRGLARAAARARLQAIRGYDFAAPRQTDDGFIARPSGPNSEIVKAAKQGRANVRELSRNVPNVRKALNIWAQYAVRTGIPIRGGKSTDAQLKAQNDKIAKDIMNYLYSRECDAGGHITGAIGLAQITRAVVSDGSAYIIADHIDPDKKNSRGRKKWKTFPVKLRFLESDYLDAKKNEEAKDGKNEISNGIEYDSDGERVAYWFFRKHPADTKGPFGSMESLSNDSVRVEAHRVIHVFAAHLARPGQQDDVSWFHASVGDIDMLADLTDAIAVRTRIEANIGVVARTAPGSEPPNFANKKSQDGKKQKLSPAGITVLEGVDDLTFINPTGSASLPEFTRLHMRNAAVGVDLPHDMYSGDLSGHNFSSLKAGQGPFKVALECFQWLILVDLVLKPIIEILIDVGITMGKYQEGDYSFEFMPPVPPAINPAEVYAAEKVAIRAGLKTLYQSIGELGFFPDEVLAEISEINGELDRLGITLDTDPRKMSNAGLTQARPAGSVIPDSGGGNVDGEAPASNDNEEFVTGDA